MSGYYWSRIHVTPKDYLLDLDEIADGSEPRSRALLYIPADPKGLNEVCDATYFTGNRVPSHEHRDGFETFLVDGGSLEILQLSKKGIAKKGDLVHIQPFMPHSIHALEDNTIWRAFHQGLWLFHYIEGDRAFRDRHWDISLSEEFKREIRAVDKSAWFDYGLPECKDVSPREIPSIRPYDFALAEYSYEGITLKLKVGRWETGGLKEVWQLFLSKGYKLSWDIKHPYVHLYDVYSGKVKVSLEGMEPFTANTRDLAHIPRFLSGTIEALEDTVLLDMGCQGFLTRFMDELNLYKQRDPKKLEDRAFIKEIMQKNDYHVLFESL
jgi:quercetin dioxygenase-like cupin family protein